MVEINERLRNCIEEAAQALVYTWDSKVDDKGEALRLGGIISQSFGVQVAILAAALYIEPKREITVDELAIAIKAGREAEV